MSSSIKVYVKAYPLFKDFIEFELPNGSKLFDIISLMAEKYKEFKENYLGDDHSLDLDVMILVNNKVIKELEYELMDGDKIYFIPPIAGG